MICSRYFRLRNNLSISDRRYIEWFTCRSLITYSQTSITKTVQPKLFQQINRTFGVMDTISNFASKRIETSKENQFSKMIQLMLDSPKWSLRQWKSTIDDQLGSWMQYIPGISSSTEVQQAKKFKSKL